MDTNSQRNTTTRRAARPSASSNPVAKLSWRGHYNPPQQPIESPSRKRRREGKKIEKTNGRPSDGVKRTDTEEDVDLSVTRPAWRRRGRPEAMNEANGGLLLLLLSGFIIIIITFLLLSLPYHYWHRCYFCCVFLLMLPQLWSSLFALLLKSTNGSNRTLLWLSLWWKWK